MSAPSPIYAFVHIPFSAGTTVRNAILASQSADEVFDCYGWRRTSATIADEIRALSPARRDRVKFLLGHQVWFGIDELFDREVRYFTFLRNPISRTVSAYWKIQRDERNFYHDAVRSMTLEDCEALSAEWPDDTTFLLDAADPVQRGGTGKTVDWGMAARVAARRRVILAGGLTAVNVAEAVSLVRPWGVDVSSGVEASPGVKNPDAVAAFLTNARAAFEHVGRGFLAPPRRPGL